MATKKIIKQVSYPGHGESTFKTVAFLPTMTVAEACNICAQKGGLKDKKDLYGLCIKDTGTWLKQEDTLASYPLEHCAGLEYKPTPKKTSISFEGEEKLMEVDFSLIGSEVLGQVLDMLGEPRSNEFTLSLISEVDGSKGPSVDYNKALIEQADPSSTKLVVKKKSKIGGIFRRTDSHKSRRETTYNPTTVPTKVFGVPLAQCAHRFKYGGLPVVAAKTMAYLTETSLQLEGIFRISGNQTEVLAMKKAFDDGQDVIVRTCSSPHVAASLLKMYLRELPEPVFTFHLYEIFIALYHTVTNPAVRVTYYKLIVDTLPDCNRTLLFAILTFLASIIEYADVNKMAIHNIATVFGPNLLHSSDTSAVAMIQGTSTVSAITCEMIENYEEIIEVMENEDYTAAGVSLFAYEGKSDRELSFEQGEIVFVSNESDASWWEGEANGNFGFFPSNYIKKLVSLRHDVPLPKEAAKDDAAPAPAEEEESTPAASAAVEPKPAATVAAPAKSAAAAATGDIPAAPQRRAAPKPQAASAAVKAPTQQKKSAGGGAGGSKQKFLSELEDLKAAARAEKEGHAALKALVEGLVKDVEQLKATAGPATGASGAGGNVSGVQAEMNSLKAASNKLESELDTANGELATIKSALDALKKDEIALKRDLKIAQFKCDKLKPAGSPAEATARRVAPVLAKP